MSIHTVRKQSSTPWRGWSIAMIATLAACTPKQQSAGTTANSAQFTLLTLERRPCFGTCPVYSVSIAGDGAVTFDGKRFVDSIGPKTSRIDQAKLNALQTLLDNHQFNTLDDKYAYGLPNCKSYHTDAPTVIISVTSKAQTKRVEHDGGCTDAPSRLSDLERKIDSVVNVARYFPKQGSK